MDTKGIKRKIFREGTTERNEISNRANRVHTKIRFLWFGNNKNVNKEQELLSKSVPSFSEQYKFVQKDKNGGSGKEPKETKMVRGQESRTISPERWSLEER